MKAFTTDFAGNTGSEICFRIDKRKTLSFGFHNHTFWEFMFVEKGKVLNTFDTHEKVLSKNELCILNPSTSHQVTNPDETEPYLLLNFEVKKEFVEQICSTLGIDPKTVLPTTYTQFPLSDNEVINSIHALNLMTDEDLDAKNENLLRITVTKFIMLAYQRKHSRIQSQNYIVFKMIEEMKNTENFHLSIKELCEKLGYSHEYVTRLFKQENFLPPNRLFLFNKLAYARNLFAHSHLSINEVASLCGIYSISYFNKTFKDCYGITPATHKKQNVKNKPNF